jgi:nucleotide-binding universal stress UspA family protein
MKTLLIATDFSATASHALRFAYYMATIVKANMVICNVVVIPIASPQAGLVVWPMENPEGLLKESKDALLQLKLDLEREEEKEGFNPAIRCISTPGEVTEVVNELIKNEDVDLVIIGTHGTGGLNSFLLGNHSRSMINDMNKPLMLIPPAAQIGPVKKIAFATDFKNVDYDRVAIYTLIEWAKPLNAHILITHIFEEENHSEEFQNLIKQFMKEIVGKTNYSNIGYRVFTGPGVASGLLWLCENGQIDILAMVHRTHNFIDSLFRVNQTYKITTHIPVPLLVFPSNS